MRVAAVIGAAALMAAGWWVTRAEAGDSPHTSTPILGPPILIAGFAGLVAALHFL